MQLSTTRFVEFGQLCYSWKTLERGGGDPVSGQEIHSALAYGA